MDSVDPRPYVNGALLSKNIGKTVTVIGRVAQMSPNGMELQIQLADGKEVKVQMEDQLTEPLEGYVQMTARVNRDNSLVAEKCISFGHGEIDLDAFNKALQVMSRHPNLFSSSEINGVMH